MAKTQFSYFPDGERFYQPTELFVRYPLRVMAHTIGDVYTARVVQSASSLINKLGKFKVEPNERAVEFWALKPYRFGTRYPLFGVVAGLTQLVFKSILNDPLDKVHAKWVARDDLIRRTRAVALHHGIEDRGTTLVDAFQSKIKEGKLTLKPGEGVANFLTTGADTIMQVIAWGFVMPVVSKWTSTIPIVGYLPYWYSFVNPMCWAPFQGNSYAAQAAISTAIVGGAKLLSKWAESDDETSTAKRAQTSQRRTWTREAVYKDLYRLLMKAHSEEFQNTAGLPKGPRGDHEEEETTVPGCDRPIKAYLYTKFNPRAWEINLNDPAAPATSAATAHVEPDSDSEGRSPGPAPRVRTSAAPASRKGSPAHSKGGSRSPVPPPKGKEKATAARAETRIVELSSSSLGDEPEEPKAAATEGPKGKGSSSGSAS